MKLAFITPTAYLNKYAKQGDFYLALAHLIDDDGKNEYARFHRREAQQGKRVILDNGLFEGAQVSTDQLLRRAEVIGAQVVCAPDVLFDSKGTIKAFKQFIKDKQELGAVFDVMGIPQANNPVEWWECFQFMQSQSDCNMVGLSILSVPESFATSAREAGYADGITGPRCYLIRELYALSVLSGTRLKPMHLLGLGESYGDVVLANRLLPRDVVSNDSSSTFVHGAAKVRYRQDGNIPGGKIREKLDFDIKYGQPAIVYPEGEAPLEIMNGHIQHNIDIAKRLANG